MLVIENENTVFCDIDDTLILYPPENSDITFLKNNGYTYFKSTYRNDTFLAKPSLKHINLIKDNKARGFYIIVWSAAGWEHAKKIIDQLNLNDYVDMILTKPQKYIDDLDVKEWIGPRIYLEDNN